MTTLAPTLTIRRFPQTAAWLRDIFLLFIGVVSSSISISTRSTSNRRTELFQFGRNKSTNRSILPLRVVVPVSPEVYEQART